MIKLYAFDVDGTLTEPRNSVDPTFNAFFHNFARTHTVYLVSGSDRAKIVEQMPQETLNVCEGLFTCSGAELWNEKGLIYRKQHSFPQALLQAAEHLIDTSPYTQRCGNHIEHRPGMLNITSVGRNADNQQRKHYYHWDKEHGERQEFIQILSSEFPNYEFSAGGEISIDIVPRGWTKAVAKTEIELRHLGCSIHFFGDRMNEGGNDKPLADALMLEPQHLTTAVSSYKDTWHHLQQEIAAVAA